MGVGERVAEARAESGLTQAQLASAVGLERSALAKIETGVRRVSAVELVAIARELRRRVEWFVEPGPPSIVSYRASKPAVATQLREAFGHPGVPLPKLRLHEAPDRLHHARVHAQLAEERRHERLREKGARQHRVGAAEDELPHVVERVALEV